MVAPEHAEDAADWVFQLWVPRAIAAPAKKVSEIRFLLLRPMRDKQQSKREYMGYKDIKHRTCPEDEGEGILLVDVETEMVPKRDRHGRKLYYCLEGQHTFSEEEDGTRGPHERRQKR